MSPETAPLAPFGTRPELAVGAIVLHGGALLMVRRGRPPFDGAWSVPGGRVEGGESLGDAVVREVAEECGIEVRCGDFLGWVERMGADRHHVILDFWAHLVGPGELAAGDDASEARWVPLDAVPELDLVPGLLDFLRAHSVLGGRSDLQSASGHPVRSSS